MKIELRGGDSVVIVDPRAGGRIARWMVAGHDLLVDRVDDPLEWGCYPMVPWAGRLRDGVLRFGGETYEFPRNLPPHAIHGLAFDRPWAVVQHDDRSVTMRFDLEEPWPFGGWVEQRIGLIDRRVQLAMEIHADDRDMPVACGWHPWFRRPVDLYFTPDTMYERGADDLPTGRLVPPTRPPWDDCFRAPRRGPVLRWPNEFELRFAGADHYVIYTEREHAICVEPQSGPPNGLNFQPTILPAGGVFRLVAQLSWDRDE